MRVNGSSPRGTGTFLVLLLLLWAVAVWAGHGADASPAASGGSKKGASGQVYVWQSGSC